MLGLIDANGAHIKGSAREFTTDEKIAYLKKIKAKVINGRDYAIIDSILGDLGNPKSKQSGCTWGVDKTGGFDVHFYISKQHLDNLKMPKSNAEIVENLIARPDGCSVLSGCSVIMGYWIKEAKREQDDVISAVKDTMQ